MLGNDVVDLQDPDARSESFSSRFDERVFDAAERRAIARDPDPQARRWAHWAAKEAAYKLAKQVVDDFVFTPGRLVARFGAPDVPAAGRVLREGTLSLPAPIAEGLQSIELRSDETAERVHVLAAPQGADWDAIVSALDVVSADDEPGLAVRRLARDAIARDLGIADERIAIGRRGSPRAAGAAKIPTVEIDGARSALAISLSHHGRWVACAMTLHPDPAAAAPDPGEGAAEGEGVPGCEAARRWA